MVMERVKGSREFLEEQRQQQMEEEEDLLYRVMYVPKSTGGRKR